MAGPEHGPATWLRNLAQHIDDLGRWVQGRLILEPEPTDEVVSSERFLDTDYLRKVIARARSADVHMSRPDMPKLPDHVEGSAKDIELRVAASRLSRHYAASLSAVAMVGLANGVGINLSPARCDMVFVTDLPFRVALRATPDDGLLLCRERPTSWPVKGATVETMEELRAYVCDNLYRRHLGPLFMKIQTIAKITPALLWTNAAEWIGTISDAAAEYLDPATAAPYLIERHALLDSAQLPCLSGEPNPLQGRLDWVSVDNNESEQRIQTRELCCLCYLLPDRFGRLCQNCPHLPLTDRLALIRERHGVPMGTPGGPAERRSIEQGLQRPSTQQALRAYQQGTP